MRKNFLRRILQKNKELISIYLKRLIILGSIILGFYILSNIIVIPSQLLIIKNFLFLTFIWTFFIFLLNLVFQKPSLRQSLFRIKIIGYAVFLSLFLISSELAFLYFFVFSFLILTTTYKFCPFGPYFIATIGSLTLFINFFLHPQWDFHNIFLLISQIFALYFWARFSAIVVGSLKEEQEQRQKVKRLYKRIEKSYDELKALNKAKDTFLEIASHQIRTPLSLIEGTLSMILKNPFKRTDRNFQENLIKKAYEGTQRLQTLARNLLSLSAIDVASIKINPSLIRLDKLAKEVYEIFREKAKFKKIDFQFKKEGKFSPMKGDEEKLKEVMEIFVDNAFKYTLSGFIKILVRSDKNWYIFEVEDSGVGIPQAIKDKLFQKFIRGENIKTISPEGTGLGLYIAQQLIKFHKGKIYFKTKEGKGSTFAFKIPQKL